jgi:hypothetical protein
MSYQSINIYIVLLLLLFLLFLLILFNYKKKSEHLKVENARYINRFVNFKFDQNGNFYDMSFLNPNYNNNLEQCINTPCSSKYHAIDSVCWVCIDQKNVANDFKASPTIEETDLGIDLRQNW